jgi:hypothetical protein
MKVLSIEIFMFAVSVGDGITVGAGPAVLPPPHASISRPTIVAARKDLGVLKV